MEERVQAVQTGMGTVQSQKEERLVLALQIDTGEWPVSVQNETQERLVAAQIVMEDRLKAVHTHRPIPWQIPLLSERTKSNKQTHTWPCIFYTLNIVYKKT